MSDRDERRQVMTTTIRSELFTLYRGDGPLLVSVPHAGTFIPDALALRMTAAANSVPDTDWHVEKLYAFARDSNVTLMAATHSRFVVDLNRDPSGAALYPGADNTELCPTLTFGNEAIYAGGDEPTASEIDAPEAGSSTSVEWPFSRSAGERPTCTPARPSYAISRETGSVPESPSSLSA